MKAKYLIELETKGGEDAPTCERMRTAAYGCGRMPDAIRAVDVTMVAAMWEEENGKAAA